MSFLMEEKAARAIERQEDLESFKLLVKEGVKEEVKVALEPLNKRLEAQEKVSLDLQEQFTRLVEQVEALKDTPNCDLQFPPLSMASSLQRTILRSSMQSAISDESESDQSVKIKKYTKTLELSKVIDKPQP